MGSDSDNTTRNKNVAKVAAGTESLLAEARKLRNSTARTAVSTTKESAPRVTETAIESLQSVRENLSFFRGLVLDVKEGVLGFYQRILAPVWRIVRPPFAFVFRQYGKVWRRFAFCTDKATGERRVSRKRSSALIILTIVFVTALTPTYPGDAIRFVTVEPVTDSILILLTRKTETFFLNHADEVDPDGNIYSVRGCRVEGQCTEKEAVYFRVRPRIAHDLWKLVTYGNPIYVPDHVIAPIAPGVNKCEVTYYGYRMTSSWIARIIRSMQIYPVMLEASCVFVHGTVPPP